MRVSPTGCRVGGSGTKGRLPGEGGGGEEPRGIGGGRGGDGSDAMTSPSIARGEETAARGLAAHRPTHSPPPSRGPPVHTVPRSVVAPLS